MIARMQGTRGPPSRGDQVNTVVDESGRMAVLKSSAQCFPIFSFHQEDIRPNDMAYAGNERLNECHVDVQRILDEFLNDRRQTTVQSPYTWDSIHASAAQPPVTRAPRPLFRLCPDALFRREEPLPTPIGGSVDLWGRRQSLLR